MVSRAQLLAAGVRHSAVDRALRAGRLHRLHPGIYSLPAPELLTEDAHLTAALLAAGDGAILARGTAAWRWQLIPAPPLTIQLLTQGQCRLRPDDTTPDGRFPITTVPRTLLDLATNYHHHPLLRALAPAPPTSNTHSDVDTQEAQTSKPLSVPTAGPRQGQKPAGAQVPPPAAQAQNPTATQKPAARPIDRRLPVAPAPARRRA